MQGTEHSEAEQPAKAQPKAAGMFMGAQARIKRGSDPAPYANQAASADAVLMDMHRSALSLISLTACKRHVWSSSGSSATPYANQASSDAVLMDMHR